MAQAPLRGKDKVTVLETKERKILRLLAKGCVRKEIASQLGRTLPAVNFDIRMIEAKLGARNGAEVVAIAFRKGILK